jgi:Domain of unknown function (DUF4129)
VSRRRLVPLALSVTFLLAVVAVSARGRPLGSGSGGGGLPISFWDYLFTTVVILLVLLLVALIVASALARRYAHTRKNFFQAQMLRSVALLTLSVLVGFFLFKHHLEPHFRLPEAQQTPSGPGKLGANGRPGAGSRTPGFQWKELATILFFLLVAAGIAAARRSRREPRKRHTTTPAGLAAALDESLDDLRTDPDLRRAIIAAYARMETALAAVGLPRRAAEAPLEYLGRALLALDTSAEAVRRLTDLFEWARFSQHEPEPAMRDDAVDALIAVRDELRASELAPA